MAKLSDLVAKATRAPYELEFPDGTVVLVPQPTLAQWAAAAEVPGGLAAFVGALGVSADGVARVQAEMMDAPYGTEAAVIFDLKNYFRLGN